MWYNRNMKHYKKRTIALCLASLVTIAGAFGAENYDNSLMGLKVNNGSNGYVSVTAYTKQSLSKPSQLIKVDNNTYTYILPKTNNSTTAPDVSGYNNIESIEILTLPYTPETEGSTKIVIKTLGKPVVMANNVLYLDELKEKQKKLIKKEEESGYQDEPKVNKSTSSHSDVSSNVNSFDSSKNSQSATAGKSSSNLKKEDYNIPEYDAKPPQSTGTHTAFAFLCVLALVLVISIIFIAAKNKMASVVGQISDFDLDEDNKVKEKAKTKRKRQRKINNKRDSIITNKTVNIVTGTITENEEQKPVEKKEAEQSAVIVNLDALYQEKTQNEQTNNSEEQNDDLADFLSEFSLEADSEEEDKTLFDERLYEEIINNKNIQFSDEDIEKINKLTQVEISLDLLDMLNEYWEKERNKPKPKTQKEVLEDLLTSYTIERNIVFSKADIDAINKLISVELDPDFVTDLRTNPGRVKVVEKSIINQRETKKPSEIMTLKVKDFLPDLSKELKKQGNKKIESNNKPQVVYFSEGYDVSKLSVSNELTDISEQIKSNKDNAFKPSYVSPIVETGYEVSTLEIRDELPDLADVKANPQKYAEKKEVKKEVDEKSLLASLSNVTFKPFYEAEPVKNNFEIKNVENKSSESKADIVKVRKVQNVRKEKRENNSQDLLALVEKQQAERAAKKQNTEDEKSINKEVAKTVEKDKKQKIKEQVQYVGEYQVIKKVEIDSNVSCRLLKKGSEYVIMGYVGEKSSELRRYDLLDNTSLQIRVHDKAQADGSQYLIKIGSHKFVIKVTKDNMEFVMDLC